MSPDHYDVLKHFYGHIRNVQVLKILKIGLILKSLKKRLLSLPTIDMNVNSLLQTSADVIVRLTHIIALVC